MKCLIIAAGKGTRLLPQYNNKPLAPVLGIPLIERVIQTALSQGLDDFYVVTGYRRAKVCRLLDQLVERCRIPINHIHNDEWDKGGNGLSVLKAKAHLNGKFLLMMGDHLVDPAMLESLLQNHLSDGDIIIAVYRNLDNPLTDINDAIKVLVHDGKVESIGWYLAFSFSVGMIRSPATERLLPVREMFSSSALVSGSSARM
jgi:choline kinase